MPQGHRNVAGQVPVAVSRLMRGGYVKKEPAWLRATLENPPLPPPYNRAKKTEAHHEYIRRLQQGLKTDQIERRLHKNHMYNVPTIRYLADRVRTQFYKDHPWETARPLTLVEPDELISAQYDTRRKGPNLRDYGRNPNVEDLVQATLCLHDEGGMSLLEAYQRQLGAYYALRAEHETATRFAMVEALEMGGHLAKSVAEKEFAKEREALRTQEDIPVTSVVASLRTMNPSGPAARPENPQDRSFNFDSKPAPPKESSANPFR